jgi:hypothetical protein
MTLPLRDPAPPGSGALEIQGRLPRGVIHADAHPEDVLTLLALLLRISPTSSGKAQIRRILALLFRELGAEV